MIFLILFYTCNSKKSDFYLQLSKIDSLYFQKNDSTAIEILMRLEQPKDSSEDLAFYNYLKAKHYARQWQKCDTSLLNFSIEYFKRNKDTLKLGYSYTYKGIFMLLANNKEEAAYLNNQAIKIAEITNDNRLKYNAYSLGSNIAKHFYDIEDYFYCAKKLFNTAKEINDNKKIGYAAYNLARSYYDRGIKDSAENCMHNCIYIIDVFCKKDKALVFNMLGEIAEDKNDIKTAISYYKDAIALDDLSAAYNNLAQLYFRLGNIEEAERLYPKAIFPKAYSKNIQIMQLYVNDLEIKSNINKAHQVLKQILAEKDSLLEEKESKNKIIQEHQLYKERVMYYANNKEQFFGKAKTMLLLLIFTATTSIIFLVSNIKLRKKLKTVKTKTKTAIVDVPVENITIKFSASKQKLKKLPDYELYLKVMSNEKNCISEKDNEYKFVQFIKSADYNITDFTRKNYQKLSNHELALVILHYILQKDKEQITNMMGISDEAFRSMKSRVDKKRII